MLLLATRSCAPSKKKKKKIVRQKKTIYLLHFSQKPQPGSQQQKLPKNDSVKYELAGSGKLPSPSTPTPRAPQLQATLCKCNLQLLYTLLIKFALQ